MSNFPDLSISNDPVNPMLHSPFVPYNLTFYQDKNTLMDIDTYIRFVKNAVSRFRRSRTYTNYKSFLMNLGLDHCQLQNNIGSDMATIEMHHNVLTIFDIAVILTEYTLNTVGYITTYDLVQLLKKVHKEHKVQLVMLNETAHQLYHNSYGMFIHPKMCFGNWIGFLEEYRQGITIEIANKVITYIDKSLEYDSTQTNDLLKLRDMVTDWSRYNEYGSNRI